MAYLFIEKWNKENEGRAYTISQQVTRIGRPSSSSDPDIPINDDWVSKEHIEITHKNGGYVLRDLYSSNGTQINGDTISPEKSYNLEHNSTIGLALLYGKPRIILRFCNSEDTMTISPYGINELGAVSWLNIDEGRKEVRVDGNLISLSKKEYCLMCFLYGKAGRKCSKDEIIAEVWSEVKDPGAVSDAAVETLIHRLRQKVEPEPSNPIRIVSSKGFGYMLL